MPWLTDNISADLGRSRTDRAVSPIHLYRYALRRGAAGYYRRPYFESAIWKVLDNTAPVPTADSGSTSGTSIRLSASCVSVGQIGCLGDVAGNRIKTRIDEAFVDA